MRRTVFNYLAVLFFMLPGGQAKALILGEQAEVSILTCGPARQLHAMYGHTAIRMKDPEKRLDLVFNYGVFSFSKPNFIYRFAKGQTDYMLAAERYDDFYEQYKHHGRSIREQVLNLTGMEKQKLWNFLEENARPENREYRYNFFFDNCATRVRDVVAKQVKGHLVFPEEGAELSFRSLIAHYQQVLPWTDFGIHLVVGSPADRIATAYEEMFLPDFLMDHFGRAQIETPQGTRLLVRESRLLYETEAAQEHRWRLTEPAVLFAVLSLLVLIISYKQLRKSRSVYGVDYVLLLLNGFAGLVLLWFVWFSEHPAMRPNYNLLWALPVNLLFLLAWMKKKWRRPLRWYWPVLAVWLVLFLFMGIWIPQHFPAGVYFIVLMLLCRALLHTRLLYPGSFPRGGRQL
ncbi:MAG: DUF4105 domain-containing protein [Mangrovibacterium sp.]